MIQTPKERESAGTRAQIIDAMGRLMERLGYNKTTIDEIAQEVGIGKGSIYLYFQGKRDIAVAWFVNVFGDLEVTLKSITELGLSSEDTAISILKTRVLFRYDRLRKLSYSLEQMFAAVKTEVEPLKHQFHEMETEMLAKILRELGGDYDEDVLPSAKAMIRATNGLIPYAIRSVDMDNRDELDELIERIARLLVSGYKEQHERSN